MPGKERGGGRQCETDAPVGAAADLEAAQVRKGQLSLSRAPSDVVCAFMSAITLRRCRNQRSMCEMRLIASTL